MAGGPQAARRRGAQGLTRQAGGFIRPAEVSALAMIDMMPVGPVSSLLSSQRECVYAGRFPVLAQRSDAAGRRIGVVLGADDKHLSFRSCVEVERLADERVVVRLGTRVRNRNLFGHVYLALIDRVHRGFVSPAMLRMAVDHAVRQCRGIEAAQESHDAHRARTTA